MKITKQQLEKKIKLMVESVLKESFRDEPKKTVKLGYDSLNILSRYWYGQGDPLYAVLSRRGNSVDWVKVDATSDELSRLSSAAEEAAQSDDPSEKRVGEKYFPYFEKIWNSFEEDKEEGESFESSFNESSNPKSSEAEKDMVYLRREFGDENIDRLQKTIDKHPDRADEIRRKAVMVALKMNGIKPEEHGLDEANKAGKTEHSGSKKGNGAYRGPKKDAKKESSKKRRTQDKKNSAWDSEEYRREKAAFLKAVGSWGYK